MTKAEETCQATVDIAISKEIVRLREHCAALEAENKSLQGQLNKMQSALLDSQNRLCRLLQRRG